MKKFLRRLLGDIFVKEILQAVGNKLITVFFIWLLGKLHNRFSDRVWFRELQNYLMDIQIEDFFRDSKSEIEAINMSDETTVKNYV